MKLIEYVNGSRQALYHGTFLDVAMEIVKDGYISSETQQQINNKTVYGVSLSRNPNVSYKFGNIIFKINPLALNQKKLIPYNWVHLNPKEKMSPREEAEEFYIDDIIINSKIISIIYILKINALDKRQIITNTPTQFHILFFINFFF